MDKQRWKQIDAVFELMLEVEPGERADALARMCAGDDDLRRRVEELLEQEAPAEDFLKSSAIAGMAGKLVEELSALAPGQRIGQYRIKERIGAGGMGEVSNIITIHDIVNVADEPAGLHFIVTELVEGRTLRERLNDSLGTHAPSRAGGSDETSESEPGTRGRVRARVGWREAVLIAAQVADALNAVHVVEIIHRDMRRTA